MWLYLVMIVLIVIVVLQNMRLMYKRRHQRSLEKALSLLAEHAGVRYILYFLARGELHSQGIENFAKHRKDCTLQEMYALFKSLSREVGEIEAQVKMLLEYGVEFRCAESDGLTTLHGLLLQEENPKAGVLFVFEKSTGGDERYHELQRALRGVSLREEEYFHRGKHLMWERDSHGMLVRVNDVYQRYFEPLKAKDGSLPDILKEAPMEVQPGSTSDVKRVVLNLDHKKTIIETYEVPHVSGKSRIGFGYDMTFCLAHEEYHQNVMATQLRCLALSLTSIAIYDAAKRLIFYNKAFCDLFDLSERYLCTSPSYEEVFEMILRRCVLSDQVNEEQFREEQLALFNVPTSKEQRHVWYLSGNRLVNVIMIPYVSGGLVFLYEVRTGDSVDEKEGQPHLSQALFDTLVDGVLVVGENGVVQSHNTSYQKMWFVSPISLKKGVHMRDIVYAPPPTHLEMKESIAQLKQWMGKQVSLRRHASFRLKQSQNRFISVRAYPLPRGSIAFVCIGQNTLS